MRAMRCASASMLAGAMLLVSANGASAQDTPQALRQEIDQLRRDFETLKRPAGIDLHTFFRRVADRSVMGEQDARDLMNGQPFSLCRP